MYTITRPGFVNKLDKASFLTLERLGQVVWLNADTGYWYVGVGGEGCTLFSMNQKIHLQIWISPERVGEKTGCLAFIGISRPYFAITNKTRVQLQGSKIRNKFKN